MDPIESKPATINPSTVERISWVIHHGVIQDRSALRAQPGDAWRPPVRTAP